MNGKQRVGLPEKQESKSLFNKLVINLLILLALAVLVFGAVTHWLAGEMGFDPALGGVITGRWYWPWQWLVWVGSWWDVYPLLMRKALLLATTGLAFAFGCYAVLLLLLRRKSKGVKGLHGTARWAEKKDIMTAGLLPAKGELPGDSVYVGAWTDKRGHVYYLTHSGAEHILAFAPTRSGKGVGLVIPTLLSWTQSLLCYDIKGENWALTAGWRKKHAGNIVMKFDPASNDGSSVRFNPLAEMRLDTDHDVADAQNIAMMVIDPDGKGLDDHWAKTGFSLLTGVILHVSYAKKAAGQEASLNDAALFLANPERDLIETLEEMLAFPHKNGAPHEVVAQEARGMLGKADKEQSGVVSTVRANLTLYLDPIVRNNISTSDFKIKDLMNHEKPVSLYLVIKPSDAQRLRPLVRLLITQIVQKLTENMSFENGRSVASYRHRLLLMLDEFASLKKLSAIEDGLAFMAGYGLKSYLIVQDLEQINNAYGQYEGLLGNCHIKIAYAPNKLKTADVLSKMTGITTVIKKQTTASGKKHGVVLGQVSESYQEVSRPLLTPDEVMKLPGAVKEGNEVKAAGDMLIFPAGFPAIYGTQILYFLDPVFSARSKLPAPPRTDRITNDDMAAESRQATESTIGIGVSFA